MIKPICDIVTCKKELEEKGALLFSPPIKSINKVFDLTDEADVTRKFHICKSCYQNIIESYFKN